MKENSTTPLSLNPMHLPDAPSWLPLAWGWWAVAAAVILVLLTFVVVIRRKRRRMAPKKTALRLLSPSQKYLTPSAAIELVRQAALCYFPREEIARLNGSEWLAFLDNQIARPLFVPNESLWQQALYQKKPVGNAQELIEHCHQWVNDALPPKKRR